MKYVLSLFLMVSFLANSYGQINFFSTQPQTQSSFNKPTTILLNNNSHFRHSISFYNDYKIGGLQVVSVHQENTPFDILYYIDKNGDTQYRSMMLTAPFNTQNNFRSRSDSLNPFGSRDIGEAVISGVLNTFFNKRVRNVSVR